MAACAVIAVVAGCAGKSPGLDVGRLGDVRILHPAGTASGIVFLFSSGQGWTARDDETARKLSEAGAIVAGVDLAQYRKQLDADDGECLYLISEIESLSQQLQRSMDAQDYLSPVMAGVGEGGTLVGAALAQSPAATVAGAISVDPLPALRTRLPLCPGAPATPATGGGFTYGAAPDLPGFWVVSFSAGAPADSVAHIKDVKAAGTPITIADTEAASAGDAAEALLIRAVAAKLSARQSPVRSLPLIELRAKNPGPYLAIVLSGDGGWRDLDKTIAESFQQHGVSTLGLDSLRYFWRSKDPQKIAADLSAAIDFYLTNWGNRRVVLVGYSFGADVLPFVYNRLDQKARDSIAQVTLLGLSTMTDFEIHVTSWLGAGDGADAVPNAAELARMPPSLIQCFVGEEEDDSGCPALEKSGVEVVHTTGGHHFDGDYDALAEKILAGVARREAAAPNQSR